MVYFLENISIDLVNLGAHPGDWQAVQQIFTEGFL